MVPTPLILDVCDQAHAKKYCEFSLRSFVDDNKRMAWCTAPDCTCAAESLVDAPREPLDVFCACGNSFCFTCKEEAHRPVDCETVRQWMIKNSNESENMTWILANTKPCPKCNRPIEKNQGCMHMTCSQCRHEFCWLCCGPWAEHGERTGGFYNCNTYKKKKEAGGVDEQEEQRAHARASLERYMHYWQRWAEHDKARRTALRQGSQWENELLEVLSERTATPVSQLKFVVDAWKEVVSCRRVLKWTYAVGYYSFDDPDASVPKEDRELKAARKEFFEFTQQDAENALERMNHKVEKQLHAFVRDDGGGGGGGGGASAKAGHVDAGAWNQFREELLGLTDVTRTQFAKLVDFLEKGLDEGLAEFTRSSGGGGGIGGSGFGSGGAGPSSDPHGSGGGNPTNAKNISNTSNATPKNNSRVAVTSPPGSSGGFRMMRLTKKMKSDGRQGQGQGGEGVVGWGCERCTFMNESGGPNCEVCGLPRPRS